MARRFRLSADVEVDLTGMPVERLEDGSGLAAAHIPPSLMDELIRRGVARPLQSPSTDASAGLGAFRSCDDRRAAG